MRRIVIFSILYIACSPVLADILVVSLLGVGTPRPIPEQTGPAVLIEAGSQKLLFDVGRGVAQQVHRIGVDFEDVNKVFITHLHYDHIVGLPDLFLSGRVFRRQSPMKVWGPSGINQYTENILEAYSDDIRFRKHLPPSSAKIIATEIVAEGVVYDHGGLKVTAFMVDHGHVKPTWGYRIDYRSRSVVISGDTHYSETLVKYAQQVDLLIHELIAVSPSLLKTNKRLSNIYGYHTKPEEIIDIMKKTRPRMTVLVHRLIFGLEPQEVLHKIRLGHDNEVIYGEDLSAFDLGENIRVYKR